MKNATKFSSTRSSLALAALATLATACNELPDRDGAESTESEATAGEAKVPLTASAVTASTFQLGNEPSDAVDNNTATRWAGSGDGAWIQFDLATTRKVTQVRVLPYNGSTRVYTMDILTSTTGTSWTNTKLGAKTVAGTGFSTIDFTDVDARYVRLVGHGNNENSWNSHWEIEVWAVSGTTTPPPPSGDFKYSVPRTSVIASLDDGNVPGNVVDGSLGTRWSASGDGQWIRLDLGATKRVTRVRLAAYNGDLRRMKFDIQTATGTTFSNALTGQQTALNTGLQYFDIPDVDARYVRIFGHGNTVNLWNSYTEIEVWGTTGGSCSPETNTQFCQRLGKNCGTVTNTDNCGNSRSVSCGSCSSPNTCVSNVCSCTAESNSQFCSRLGKNCGTVTANDNCGRSRSVSCGTCTSPATCGGGGTPNVCGTSGGLTWRKANLTWFTSYPDPGSEECIKYNGCMWAGYFAFVSGKMPESWVMANNIAAIHERDAATYKLKTLRLKQGTKQIDVKVYDMCSDSDCSGCCTANARETGFLIDVEKYTAQRFGTNSGIVDWACLDCN
jgi:hypothetical protein